jgi:PAS domain S-box-containing protein
VPDLSSALEYRAYTLSTKELRSQISFPIVLKGKAFGALNIGSRTPNAYADGDAHILQPIAQQIGTIIDRVQLFRQVTEDSAYIHALLDSIGSIVYTVDTQYRIREVNKAWHEFMQDSGFPGIRNYQGMNLFDVLPSQTLKEMFRPVVDDIVAGKVRVYVQEFVHATVTGDRFYQLTVNPMTIDRKVTGLVFTHSDITALKKTEKQLKRSNEQLLALNRISTLISTSLDLTEILDTTIPLLHKETESEAVLVYLFEQYTHELTLAKEVGFASSGRQAGAGLAKGSSVTGTVMLTKEPVYINERAHLDERVLPEKREILQMVHIEAMAVIPLASKNQVWGALEIFYERPHEFSPQEQQMLSLVGNQLGTAIENAQLYQELRSQINRLTVLYEISQHLTSTLEIDEIFTAVHESIRHVVPYETMVIALYDAGTASKTIVFRASPDKGAKIVDTARRKAELLVPGSAEAIVVETKLLHRDPEFHTVYVPMFSKEAIIGIMSVRGAPTTTLTETHLRLLESVGNLTALAVEKAKLYEETLKISLEIQRRNKELDDFTYVVSHDLKEPLISIEGFSRILQADYREIIQEEGKDYLDSIVGATTRMKGSSTTSSRSPG